MGLGTWAAFQGANENAMVMGDTVLFQDEVNPVMSAALDNGLSVTALHNHFFFDEPKVYFMHIGGAGDVKNLAGAVRKVYDKIKEIRAANPKPATAFGSQSLPGTNSITAAPLNEIFGMQGEAKDGMVKFTIGKKSSMGGMEIGKTIGVNTWAAFAGGDNNAVVDGDFAMTEDELQPVLKTLRNSGINIVAIHNHMTHETPPYVSALLGKRNCERFGELDQRRVAGCRRIERDNSTAIAMKARSCLHLLLWVGALFLLICTSTSGTAADGEKFLMHVKDVPLPGGATRFDYQSLDTSNGRLYLSHMGDGNVVVYDTRSDQVVANIAGFPTVTGVLVLPLLKTLYASVAGNHEIAAMDTEAFGNQKNP